jgi:predicted membrane-bound spermidine synthase
MDPERYVTESMSSETGVTDSVDEEAAVTENAGSETAAPEGVAAETVVTESVDAEAAAAESASPGPPRSWLWRPLAIVFISSACMMILELVAGRIIAPYVGVSLYTWTAVIGVMLAGMSLGNYLGGRLADRRASLRLLGILFLAGGLVSMGILAGATFGVPLPDAWPILLRILVLTAALFFLPSMLLGTITPVVVKLALQDLTKTGRTVGRIYAAGAAGSILGTFATGFVLISAFDTHTIVGGVVVVLLVLGALFMLTGAREAAVQGAQGGRFGTSPAA